MFAELVRWNPLDELFALTRQLDRHSVRAGHQAGLASAVPPFVAQAPVDLTSDENGWHLRVAVPGIPPEDVEVQVAGRSLQIRAVDRDGDSTRARYEQTVLMPELVEVERIAATCRHGLLDVFLPFRDTVKPRRISISTEEAKRLSE